MGANGLDEYWAPEHVKDYLRKLGLVLPLDDIGQIPKNVHAHFFAEHHTEGSGCSRCATSR